MSDNDVDSDNGNDTQHEPHSDEHSSNETLLEQVVPEATAAATSLLWDSEEHEIASDKKDNEDNDEENVYSSSSENVQRSEKQANASVLSTTSLARQATIVDKTSSPHESHQTKDKSLTLTSTSNRQTRIIYWSSEDTDEKKQKQKPRKAATAVQRKSSSTDDLVIVVKELNEDVMRHIVKGSLKYECQPSKRVLHLYIHSAETGRLSLGSR